ncbi:hypothetical protein A1O3_06327 [Capronia epimyces CBS 606.96]|uniref:Uncharacterized protein n=1 Tax=Capronia epimyces CBS 606.96 TaxID=1182542 RepID=W9YJS2_9EURO|nr:uncharacterized protein A1O3_06327 [Capronia epimyces CBS 606.96]EXJ82514.1 hypothetical protein A1O3_06327 [Capronia epimyces CBS 606.96]
MASTILQSPTFRHFPRVQTALLGFKNLGAIDRFISTSNERPPHRVAAQQLSVSISLTQSDSKVLHIPVDF